MKKILNNVHTMFSPEEAVSVAYDLNADPDDDWAYVVKHDPKGTGYSLITIYEDNGEFVAIL